MLDGNTGSKTPTTAFALVTVVLTAGSGDNLVALTPVNRLKTVSLCALAVTREPDT